MEFYQKKAVNKVIDYPGRDHVEYKYHNIQRRLQKPTGAHLITHNRCEATGFNVFPLEVGLIIPCQFPVPPFEN